NASIQKVEKKEGSNGSNVFSILAIVLCLVIGFLVWKFIMGAPSNFEDNNPEGHPLPGNYLAMVYKGGYVVPVLMGLFLMSVVFSIERLFVINKAAGKGNVETFVKKVQNQIAAGNI